MIVGRRLLEALIVLCKIDVVHSIKEIKKKGEKEEEEDEIKGESSNYAEINAKDIEKELVQNKKLISMTMGDEGGSSGSDSEPSADNLEEEEMGKIIPQSAKAQKPKVEPKKPLPLKKPILPVKKPQSSSANQKR